MQKIVLKEAAVYALIFITLTLLMHPDLLSEPSERLAQLQKDGNYIHPFLYSLILYAVIGLFRLVIGWIKKIFTKKDQTK